MEKPRLNGFPTTEVDNILEKLYYHSRGDAAFGTAQRLYREAKKQLPNLKIKTVELWLQRQVSHTRHKQPRLRFPRRKTLFLRQNDCFSGDLIDCTSLATYNRGYSYIFTNVDNFSRRLFLRKLKTKNGKEVAAAFLSVIEENNGISPRKYWTDRGTDFINPQMQKIYDDFNIVRYSIDSPIKSAYAEVQNRRIENLLYKIMTSLGSANWESHLDTVCDILNNQKLAVLGQFTPLEAHKPENEEILRSKFLKDYAKFKQKFKHEKPKFYPGQTVRRLKKRNIFTRGYEPAWENEYDVVQYVVPSYPLQYKLRNRRGKWYAQELIAAQPPETEKQKNYFIAGTKKVNQKRLRNGKLSAGEVRYLLRARNDPDQSTYISQTDLDKLKDGGFI